jgi:hypothetical protein
MKIEEIKLEEINSAFEKSPDFNQWVVGFETFSCYSIQLDKENEYYIFEPYFYNIFRQDKIDGINIQPFKNKFIEGYKQGMLDFQKTYVMANNVLHDSVFVKLDEWQKFIIRKITYLRMESIERIGNYSGHLQALREFHIKYPRISDNSLKTKPKHYSLETLNLSNFREHIEKHLKPGFYKMVIENEWFLNLDDNEEKKQYKIFESTIYFLLNTHFFANKGLEYFINSFKLGYKKGEDSFQKYIDKNKISDLNIKYKIWAKEVKRIHHSLNIEGIEKIGKDYGLLSGFIDHMKDYPKDIVNMLKDEPFEIENLEIIFALFINNEEEKMALLKSYRNQVSIENGKIKIDRIIERLSILKQGVPYHPKIVKDEKPIMNLDNYHQFIREFYSHIPEDNCNEKINERILQLKQKCNELEVPLKLINDPFSNEAAKLKNELNHLNLYREYLEMIIEDFSLENNSLEKNINSNELNDIKQVVKTILKSDSLYKNCTHDQYALIRFYKGNNITNDNLEEAASIIEKDKRRLLNRSNFYSVRANRLSVDDYSKTKNRHKLELFESVRNYLSDEEQVSLDSDIEIIRNNIQKYNKLIK